MYIKHKTKMIENTICITTDNNFLIHTEMKILLLNRK